MEQGLEGEKGLKNYSTAINNVGIVLQYTPLAPLGVALNAGSDLIDTGLDIKNNNPYAMSNGLTRLATFGAGEGLGNVIKKLPVKDFNKQAIEGAVNQGGEIIEDGTNQ